MREWLSLTPWQTQRKDAATGTEKMREQMQAMAGVVGMLHTVCRLVVVPLAVQVMKLTKAVDAHSGRHSAAPRGFAYG